MPRVLIVEDVPFERRRVREMVRTEGYDTGEAENGIEALAEIDEHRPDCIITDLMMPKMDGFALLAELRALHCRIPVIVVTSDAQDETREDCERLGAVAVFHKPWDEEQLAQTMHRVLRDKLEAAG